MNPIPENIRNHPLLSETSKVPVKNLCTDDFALYIEVSVRSALRFIQDRYVSGLSAVTIAEGPANREERRSKKKVSYGSYFSGRKEIFIYLKRFREDPSDSEKPLWAWVWIVFFHELGHHYDLWLKRSHPQKKPIKEAAADKWGDRFLKEAIENFKREQEQKEAKTVEVLNEKVD